MDFKLLKHLPKDSLKKLKPETTDEVFSGLGKRMKNQQEIFKYSTLIILIITLPYYIHHFLFIYLPNAEHPITLIYYFSNFLLIEGVLPVGLMVFGCKAFIFKESTMFNWTHRYTLYLGYSNLETSKSSGPFIKIYGIILFILGLLLYPPILEYWIRALIT